MLSPLAFCFDVISPFAYVAWHRIHAIGQAYGRDVEPVPVLFAAMLDAHGQKGPAEIPAKREYAFKDAYRKAFRAGLPPLTPPPSHPFNPLLALRVATAVKLEATWSARLREVIDGLFAAVWAGAGGVESPESVARVVTACGLDAPRVLERAVDATTKLALKGATNAAIRDGAFGVPTVFCDGELFWGVDGLESLIEYLEGRDPIDAAALERWSKLTASAVRGGGSGLRRGDV